MPKKNLNSEIRACIDSFAEELSGLVHRAALESVMEAIGGATAPAKRGPGRPRKAAPAKKKAASRKKRGRRSSDDVNAVVSDITAFVRSNPGCSVGEIGAALGMTTKEMRLPLQKLGAERRVKTKGQKRGTRYYPGSGKASKTSAKKATRKKAKRGKKKGKR